MTGAKAAIRYAKALLDLARDKQAADRVHDDMKHIFQVMNQGKGLQLLLKNPVIKSEVKKAALKTIFPAISPLTQGLINLLIENKRIYALGIVAEKYIIQYNQWKGNQTATVTTAIPLTDELKSHVLATLKTLTTANITLENKIDEAIIGGFVLRVGDWQYDASIITKLNNLKREFNNDLFIPKN